MADEKKLKPEDLLVVAARRGRADLCALAKERGARNFDRMLSAAARGGRRDVCELARAWGATDLQEMYDAATACFCDELRQLAKQWYLDGMWSALALVSVDRIREAHEQLKRRSADGVIADLIANAPKTVCGKKVSQLAFAWNIPDFNRLLARAAYAGREDYCELAKACGATDFECMLERAAEGGHRDLCELAREWGARNYDQMLTTAKLARNVEVIALAEKWIEDE